MLSIGAGVRLFYSKATIKSNGSIVAIPAGGLGSDVPGFDEYATITRNMEGDSTAFVYNLALSINPLENLTLAVTYRSEVDFDMEGDGTMTASNSFPGNLIPGLTYQGPGSVSIPIPATLALAASYTLQKTIIELVYDRTFWSTYDSLTFNYGGSLGHAVLDSAFNTSIPKNWDDVNAFRLGLTHQWNDNLSIMGAGGDRWESYSRPIF